MNLHELSPAPGSTRKPYRKGRGTGSGNGKTAGKGAKGQNARSGGGVRPGFEGGQMPLQRRVPKRGFVNIYATEYAIVNLCDLEKRFKDGDTVDEKTLVASGLLKKTLDGVKVLGRGELTKKLNVNVTVISASAKQKIEAAGGKVTVAEKKPKPEGKKAQKLAEKKAAKKAEKPAEDAKPSDKKAKGKAAKAEV